MLRAIASELEEAGISDDQITVLVALGTHRQQTEEETAAVCGKDMVRRLKVVQHDCHDDSQLVSVGTTSYGNDVRLNRLAVEADTVILTGAVSFHDMAGFGGGRKAVLPGIAGYDTIMTNHALALNDGSPV
jgi:nickel-dependent lactate racemase